MAHSDYGLGDYDQQTQLMMAGVAHVCQKHNAELQKLLGGDDAPGRAELKKYAAVIADALQSWYSRNRESAVSEKGSKSVIKKAIGLSPAGDAAEIFGLVTSGKTPLGRAAWGTGNLEQLTKEGSARAAAQKFDQRDRQKEDKQKANEAKKKLMQKWEEVHSSFVERAREPRYVKDEEVFDQLGGALYDANTISQLFMLTPPEHADKETSKYAVFKRL